MNFTRAGTHAYSLHGASHGARTAGANNYFLMNLLEL